MPVGVEDLLKSVPSNRDGSVRSRKTLGAYYTDATVASFLVRWAIVGGREVVLAPSSGDGVFLTAAAERISKLGGDPGQQVYGVEIDEVAHRRSTFRAATTLPMARLLHASFFDIETADLPTADAVIGNPPFVRYQRFNGEMRQTALRRAREAGVVISRLASSWAPFLVHAIRFVRPGGRLAMVAPAELAHAAYARPVLEYLRRSFRTVRILTFSRKLFPALSEDTVLLLAAGRGEPFEDFRLIDLSDSSELANYPNPEADLPEGIQMDASAVGQGRERLLHYLLPQRLRGLYAELQRSARVAAMDWGYSKPTSGSFEKVCSR